MADKDRATVGERLASNPGTPIAAAAVLVAGFSPFSPIRSGIQWIRDGVRRASSRGTVGGAPAAPIPPADAGAQPQPSTTPAASPVAPPTPEPEPAPVPPPAPTYKFTDAEAKTLGHSLSYIYEGPGLAGLRADSEHRAIGRAYERHLQRGGQLVDGGNIIALWELEAGKYGGPRMTYGDSLGVVQAIIADAAQPAIPTLSSNADFNAAYYARRGQTAPPPLFTPPAPEPAAPGLPPSPQGSSNDGMPGLYGPPAPPPPLFGDDWTVPGGEQVGRTQAKLQLETLPLTAFDAFAETTGYLTGHAIGWLGYPFGVPEEDRKRNERTLERVEEKAKSGFRYWWRGGLGEDIKRRWF